MRRYTTVHPLYLSFYSSDLYQDVGHHWGRVSFLYLLLLLSVCLIPLTFKMRVDLSDYLDREAPKIIRQFPVITIAKGTVSVDALMPYIITEPESSAPLFIIDTTGQITSLTDSDAAALLTRTELIVRKSPKEIRSFDLSNIDDLRIDQPTLYRWVETFTDNFIFILFPLALLFSYSFRLIEAIICGMIGVIIARRLNVILGYQALLSLSIVSMTPSIIINTAYDLIGMYIPFWWLLNFLIALGYFIFAVRSNAAPQDITTA